MATDLSTASADFSLNLLRKLQGDAAGQNVFFSPISVSVALGMTYGGADGNTKAEMEKVLFGGLPEEKVHEGMRGLVAALNPKSDAYALHTANRLFAQQDFNFKKDFLDLCADAYKSSLRPVDFAKQAETVRLEINDWVAETTKDRIKDLIAEGVLDSLTRLVLVNAIYFKGTWREQFKKDNTRKETFYVAPGKETQVDMMHLTKSLMYTETGAVQVLGMGYEGSDLAMYVFLPKDRFGLGAWLDGLNGADLLGLIRGCRSEKVQVSLPKWKMETSFELSGKLKALGVVDAFDGGKADFSRITDEPKDKLCISAVIHKAFIEVNEEGAEAAAATAVVMTRMCMVMSTKPEPIFTADHPMTFAVVHEKQAVLFFGTFVQ